MSAKDLIEIIREDVHDVKEKGLTSVTVENLLRYLDDLDKNVDSLADKHTIHSLTPTELESYKADFSLMDREVFRVVNDRYMQDLREFFTRSNFYLVAEGGLLSVFFARNVPHITSNLLNWGVVASGLVLALLWWLVAWGAAYWIRRWRQEVWRLDISLNRFRSITSVEETFTRRRWSQPEYVTKFLPIGFSVVWIGLAVVLYQFR